MTDHDRPPEPTIVEQPDERARQRRTWLIVAIVAAIAAGILIASSVWNIGGTSDDKERDRRHRRARSWRPKSNARCKAPTTRSSGRCSPGRRGPAAATRRPSPSSPTSRCCGSSRRCFAGSTRICAGSAATAFAVLQLPPGHQGQGRRRHAELADRLCGAALGRRHRQRRHARQYRRDHGAAGDHPAHPRCADRAFGPAGHGAGDGRPACCRVDPLLPSQAPEPPAAAGRRGRASIARTPAPAAKSRCATMPAWPRSTGRWRRSSNRR